MTKTEVIKFGDFMSGDYKQKRTKKTRKMGKYGITIPAAALPLGASKAFASTGEVEAVPVNVVGDSIRQGIANSFDPLIELMVAISLPIASVMVTGSALMIMIGMSEKGYGWLMKASLGYVLVQMSPLFINVLAGVGEAV
ncbi:hypothetical protein SAMN05192559_104116 [Halobacillus karajensis]|uniref:hypothetical protein n=1 Tax=Halobacillus karajensis TaxID=195088 RepID=UPI0008A76A05|nr:hypothetical protein [Halobacillus karajensis]SEH78741.1 hypothetical protein SAMN05192559_104116 [Halobacillus karajensis]